MSASPRVIFNWKDPANVAIWRREFEARRTARKQPRSAYDDYLARSLSTQFETTVDPHDAMQGEYESILERARRMEKKTGRKFDLSQVKHNVPKLLARAGNGGLLKHPLMVRASEGKVVKSEMLYDSGLIAKAHREIACGILGGEVACENGCKFLAAYECGNRYCVTCGPRGANNLFARKIDGIRTVAQELMRCGATECSECEQAIKEKRLPHWPPPHGTHPRVVCAKIDFTVRYDKGLQFPSRDRMRELNKLIKKFWREAEKKFAFKRAEYGFAYCDELGGNNDNPHAHGVYVGPWLPNGRKGTKEPKPVSELWEKVTRASSFAGSFIVSLKYADTISAALYHAVKYPAKFATRSSPKRLAELEIIFHRVRRFHTLASFYNPRVPKPEKTIKRCPKCGGRMLEWFRFEGLKELRARGLKTVDEVAAEVKFAEANAAARGSP